MILKQAFGLQARISMDGKSPMDLDDLYFGSYIMSDAVGSDYFPCDKYETILQVFEPFIWTYGDASSVMLSSCF